MSTTIPTLPATGARPPLLNLEDGTSAFIPLSKTIPSRTNRRHVRDTEADNELVESIKTHGVVQPIMVRPIAADATPYHRVNEDPAFEIGEQIYEVVAGHRRFEASIKAGKEIIPAVIRELTDEQALEIQNIENLQRKDLDPVDRALATADLCDLYAKSMTRQEAVKKLAERLSCKVRTVYNMMNISNLIAEAQAALRSSDIGLSHGYLLGALRPEVQKRALKEARDYDGGPFCSVRELENWIGEEVYCLLDSAEFKKADASLVPEAGACTKCQKNSAVNPNVAPGAKSPTCTDPACFKSKKQAYFVHIQSKPKTSGAEPSNYEKQLHLALHSYPDAAKRWEKLRRKGASDAELLKQIGEEFGNGSISTLNGWVSCKGGKKPGVWFDSMDHTGKPSLQAKALVDAVRKLLEISLPTSKSAAPKTIQDHTQEDARVRKMRDSSEKQDEQANRRGRIEARISTLLLDALASKSKLDNFLLQQVATTFLVDVDDPFADWDEDLDLTAFVQKQFGWPAPKSESVGYVYGDLEKLARQTVAKMKEQKLAALLLLMVILGQMKHTSDPLTKSVLADLAKHYKVDLKKIRKQATAELKEEDKAAAAPPPGRVQTFARKGGK